MYQYSTTWSTPYQGQQYTLLHTLKKQAMTVLRNLNFKIMHKLLDLHRNIQTFALRFQHYRLDTLSLFHMSLFHMSMVAMPLPLKMQVRRLHQFLITIPVY